MLINSKGLKTSKKYLKGSDIRNGECFDNYVFWAKSFKVSEPGFSNT